MDDKGVSDGEFTPEGEKNWTESKYQKKLKDLAQTIQGLENKHPVIVGLTEVEDKGVVEDLINTYPLSEFKLEIIHQDSPDTRGIDTCLLYDKEHVKYLSHQYLRINFPWNLDIKTRDILFFECEMDNEHFWIVVNHWPSRRSESSEKKRIHVAISVQERIKSIMLKHPDSKCLMMGDFNDEPNNLSITRYLKAKSSKNISSDEFYNLAYVPFEKGKGSSVHEGNWLMIDQIMVNRAFLQNNNKGIGIRNESMKIGNDDTLIHRSKYEEKPNQTYLGDRYVGGISDHLPIYVILD